MSHRELFPQADPTNNEQRVSMKQWLAELEEDISSPDTYTKKSHLAEDKKMAKKIKQWLALPV